MSLAFGMRRIGRFSARWRRTIAGCDRWDKRRLPLEFGCFLIVSGRANDAIIRCAPLGFLQFFCELRDELRRGHRAGEMRRLTCPLRAESSFASYFCRSV